MVAFRRAALIHGVVALWGAGWVIGLVRVAGELRFHVLEARGALALVGVALLTGIVLGLWLPRLAIRWQLGRRPVPAAGFDARFVADVVGGLLVVQAVLWAVLLPLLPGLEPYRAWLVDHFGLPPAALRVLLLAPVIVVLTLLASVSATMLVGVHVWHRLRTWPHTQSSDLWLTLALAAGFTGLLMQRAGGSVALAATTGLLAAVMTRRRQPAAAPPVGSAERGVATGTVIGLLVVLAMAAAATGAAIIARAPSTLWLEARLAPTLASYSLVVCLGVIAGRLMTPRSSGLSGGAGLLAGIVGVAFLAVAVAQGTLGRLTAWLVLAATVAFAAWTTELFTRAGFRAGRVFGLVGTATLAGLGGAWLAVGITSQGGGSSPAAVARAPDAAALPPWLALRAWQCTERDCDVDDPRCWNADLAGPCTDVLLLTFAPSADRAHTDVMQRMTRRLRRNVRTGGCLLLRDPSPAALAAFAHTSSEPCYRVAPHIADAEQIVMCGPDVPEILAYISRLRDLTFAMERVASSGS